VTREEAITQLKAIAAEQDERREPGGYTDLEGGHGEADDILLALINDGEVTAAYQKIGKWYS
jgi:hypothetical protein